MSTLNAYYKGINALAAGQLTEAVRLQEAWLTKLHDGDLNDQRTSLLSDNQLMLGYFLRVGDENTGVRCSLIARAYVFLDEVYEQMRLKTNSRHEFELLRNIEKQTRTLSDVSRDPYDVFDYFWLTRTSDDQQRQRLADLFKNDDSLLAQTAISAVMLNALRRFSQERLLWLMEGYISTDNDIIRQRLIVAICLLLLKYDRRLSCFPKLISTFDSMLEVDGCRELMLSVLQQMVLTLRISEADDAVKMVQNKVFDMMRDSKTMGDKLSKLIVIDEEDEDQPEWLRRFQDSLTDTISRISQLAEQGVDVNFSHFKPMRDFRFFTSAEASWFIPFYCSNKRLNIDFSTRIGTLLSSALERNGLCDSDKYALCVMYQQMQSIKEISDEQWKAIAEQIEDYAQTPLEANLTAKHYLQDIYRYFQLNAWKVPDDFSTVLDTFVGTTLLKKLSPSSDWLIGQADVLARTGRFASAIELYKWALGQLYDSPDVFDGLGAQLYQKIGYAYESTGMFKEALDAYTHADIFSVDQRWTLWHIAKCELQLEHYDKALELIERLCRLFSPSRRYLLFRAAIFERLGNHDAANEVYFEMLAADANDAEVLRHLSRSLLLGGHTDKAIGFSEQLVSLPDPSQEDRLLHAWLLLFNSDIRGAHSEFLKAEADRQKRLELFDADAARIPHDVLELIPQSRLSLFRDLLCSVV